MDVIVKSGRKISRIPGQIIEFQGCLARAPAHGRQHANCEVQKRQFPATGLRGVYSRRFLLSLELFPKFSHASDFARNGRKRVVAGPAEYLMTPPRNVRQRCESLSVIKLAICIGAAFCDGRPEMVIHHHSLQHSHHSFQLRWILYATVIAHGFHVLADINLASFSG